MSIEYSGIKGTRIRIPWRKRALKAFLADIFDKTDMKISLKTRIGLNRADEFDDILDIYQAFPVEMLIVHPRIRMDYYSGKPDMEAFEKARADAFSCLL